jgi:putative endonuclease
MAATYILYSREIDKYYAGSTDMEMADRLKKHLSNHDGFTGTAKDWVVVYHNQHPSTSAARQEEMKIKRAKSRKVIEQIVSRFNER